MKDIVAIESMRPEPKRDQYGRYLLPDLGGATRPWTRATTLAHTLDDPFALTQWKRRMVLQGAARRPELLALVPTLEREIAEAAHWREAKAAKAQLDELADDAARAAGAEDGSKLGTLLHTITEYDDADRLGEIVDQVPEELVDDLLAYRSTMDSAGIGRPVEYIERIVINPEVGTAGTFDRLLRLADGRLVVGDLKTQKSVEFGWLAICIQLAEYVRAGAMWDAETGKLVPLPADLDLTRGIVMHLPVGQATCTLYELDLEAGWEAAKLAYQVREFRNQSKAMGWPLATARAPLAGQVLTSAMVRDEPVRMKPATAETALAQARYLIANAKHPDALTALWRDLSTVGLWTAELTQLAAQRKRELA